MQAPAADRAKCASVRFMLHSRTPSAARTCAKSLKARRSPADELVVLVALAGDQHDVAGDRGVDGRGDRRRAIVQHLRAPWLGEPGEDVRDDALRILAARIVVGDEERVGERLGDPAHLRALAAVALAAAAEHAQQPPAAMRARGAQRACRARRACARNRRSRAAACRRRRRCMRPGGAWQCASRSQAGASARPWASSTPSTVSRLSTLKSPSSRWRAVPDPSWSRAAISSPRGRCSLRTARMQRAPGTRAAGSLRRPVTISVAPGGARAASSRPSGSSTLMTRAASVGQSNRRALARA